MEIYFGNEKLEIYFQFEISISRASANLHRSAFVSRKNLTRNICILCSSQRSTKTKRENPSLFFFFFFNAIKAADRHRGLAQRGISQSQLIASSFSFFFFFFCSIGSPPAKGFIHPLPSSIGEQWNSTSLLAGVLIATRKFYHWNTVCHD